MSNFFSFICIWSLAGNGSCYKFAFCTNFLHKLSYIIMIIICCSLWLLCVRCARLSNWTASPQFSNDQYCFVATLMVFLFFFCSSVCYRKPNLMERPCGGLRWFTFLFSIHCIGMHRMGAKSLPLYNNGMPWHCPPRTTVPLLCAQNQPIIIINVWHGCCPLLRDKQGQLVNNFDRKTQQMNSIVEYFVSVKQQQ